MVVPSVLEERATETFNMVILGFVRAFLRPFFPSSDAEPHRRCKFYDIVSLLNESWIQSQFAQLSLKHETRSGHAREAREERLTKF